MKSSENPTELGTDSIVDPSVIDPNFLLHEETAHDKYQREVAGKILTINDQIQKIIKSISEMTFVGKLQELLLSTKEKELQRLYNELNSLHEAQDHLKQPTIH